MRTAFPAASIVPRIAPDTSRLKRFIPPGEYDGSGMHLADPVARLQTSAAFRKYLKRVIV